MREEEEEELLSPEELMPLSQSLITPNLALAFDIPNPNHPQHHHHHHPPPPPPPHSEFAADSGDLGSGGDEQARTLKRPRLVWTPQLHKRFVDAVAHLGIKNAVPKTIMQLMSVDGLTRENVASHLQKYRLYLKRMQQGLSGGGGGANGGDSATDRLFASSPVPSHFLHPGKGSNSDHFSPFVALQGLQHHHHHQQQQHQQHIAAVAATVGHPHLVNPYHRQMGQFGSLPNGQFEHPLLANKQPLMHRMGGAALHNQVPSNNYMEDLESANGNGMKVLTLFPTGGD